MSYNFAVDDSGPSDLYAFQRDELLTRLKGLCDAHEPWVVHGDLRLTPDDLARLLFKIRQGYGFSRRERCAMTDAGFQVDHLFPGR